MSLVLSGSTSRKDDTNSFQISFVLRQTDATRVSIKPTDIESYLSSDSLGGKSG